MGQIIPLDGLTFNRWTVLRRGVDGNCQQIQYDCRCVCGVEKTIGAQSLKSGASKSCGCWKREVDIKRKWKHGNTVFVYPLGVKMPLVDCAALFGITYAMLLGRLKNKWPLAKALMLPRQRNYAAKTSA